MNKIIRMFFVSLVCSIALPMHAQVPQNDLPFIKRNYRKFMADLKVIKKCYFSKSKCDPEEKKQAQRAVKRLTATGSILIGALIALVIVKRTFGEWRKAQLIRAGFINFLISTEFSQGDRYQLIPRDTENIVTLQIWDQDEKNYESKIDIVKREVSEYNKNNKLKIGAIKIEFYLMHTKKSDITFLWKNNQWKKIGR